MQIERGECAANEMFVGFVITEKVLVVDAGVIDAEGELGLREEGGEEG